MRAFEVNLPVIPIYHTSVCITELSWRAATTLPSGETKPENALQLLMSVQSMGPDYCLSEVNFRHREFWVLLKKAIENEMEDDHHHISGEYRCASTSAMLHPLQEEHRTRNNAEKD